MKKLVIVFSFAVLAQLLYGCSSKSSASDNAVLDCNNEVSTAIDYSIVSEGYQTDITNQQIHRINKDLQYSEHLSMLPSLSGDIPAINLHEYTLISILSGFSNCNDLEITGIEENDSTITVHALKVRDGTASCDPPPLVQYAYVFIKIPLASAKPISVVFETTSRLAP